MSVSFASTLLLLAPLIFLLHLLQLHLGPVVLDVEHLADLVGRLAFDHVGDLACCEPQQSRDVQVVGGGDLIRISKLEKIERKSKKVTLTKSYNSFKSILRKSSFQASIVSASLSLISSLDGCG